MCCGNVILFYDMLKCFPKRKFVSNFVCFTFCNAALHLSARRWQLSYSVYSAGGELLTSTEEIVPPTRFGVPGWRVSNLWGSSPCGSYRGSYSSAYPVYSVLFTILRYYTLL